jgi:hypothetical protein
MTGVTTETPYQSWVLPGWEPDAPDHWRREVDDRFTLSAWPGAMADLVDSPHAHTWELWDRTVDVDEPTVAGSADSLADAMCQAEAELKRRR